MHLDVNKNNIVTLLSNKGTGKDQYSVDLGNIVFNDTIYSLNGVIIPLFDQTLFLPSEQGMFAAVNVYLSPATGEITYDKVSVFSKFQETVDADCLFNIIPLAQFIIQQQGTSFIVTNINEYSRMSTFSLTTNGDTGAQGLIGPQGFTGLEGFTGVQGHDGVTGVKGTQGLPGFIGQSIPGVIGLPGSMGLTGLY